MTVFANVASAAVRFWLPSELLKLPKSAMEPIIFVALV